MEPPKKSPITECISRQPGAPSSAIWLLVEIWESPSPSEYFRQTCNAFSASVYFSLALLHRCQGLCASSKPANQPPESQRYLVMCCFSLKVKRGNKCPQGKKNWNEKHIFKIDICFASHGCTVASCTNSQIHKYASANTQINTNTKIQYKYKMGPKMKICTVARLSLPPADGGLASEQLLPTSNM